MTKEQKEKIYKNLLKRFCTYPDFEIRTNKDKMIIEGASKRYFIHVQLFNEYYIYRFIAYNAINGIYEKSEEKIFYKNIL